MLNMRRQPLLKRIFKYYDTCMRRLFNDELLSVTDVNAFLQVTLYFHSL